MTTNATRPRGNTVQLDKGAVHNAGAFAAQTHSDPEVALVEAAPIDRAKLLMDALILSEVPPKKFQEAFTPQLILDNAKNIYEYLGENGGEPDSVARESLFAYASAELGVDYDVLYDAWLDLPGRRTLSVND
jgi:hypothetical protein